MVGTRALFLRDLLRPTAASLRYMLVALHHGWMGHAKDGDYQRVSLRRAEGDVAQGMETGFLPSGTVFIRIDIGGEMDCAPDSCDPL